MAGVQLGFLKYVLGFDSLLFKKGISDADADLAKLQKSFQRTAGKLAKLGGLMSVGLTAPLAAFGKSAFTAASDAAELDSAFDQTFGSMSKRMSAWAEATGNAMGRSTQEIKKAANTFGIFFNTALPPEKAAQMSATFAKLAEDLGSFFNVDTETAIEKLRSGLAGEAEPMRAFGVFLSDNAVKAKAYALGIADAGAALTEQQKIQARAAIILEQTAKAQGDVARTSSGTANQVRAAQAAFEELQVTIGTKLLPVITPVIGKVAELLNWFSGLPQPVKDVGVAIAGVTAVVGPFLIGFGAIINAVGKIGPLVLALTRGWGLMTAALTALVPVIATVGRAMLLLLGNPLLLGAAALITGIYLAWKNWDKIGPIVERTYNAVKTWIADKMAAVLNAALAPIRAVTDAFREMWDKVVGHSYVPDMVDGIAAEFGRLDGVMVGPTLSATQKVARAFQGIALDGLDRVGDAIADVVTGTASLKQAFADVARSIIADIVRMTVKMLIFRAISGIFGNVVKTTATLPSAGGSSLISAGIPFGGYRAAGGPVVPGKSYVVGENGPELVSFGNRGFVTPAGDAGGGRASVELRIATDGNFRAEVAEVAGQVVVRAAPTIVAASARATRRSLTRPAIAG